MTVDVDVTDSTSYNLELYVLDFGNDGRSEQIQLTNATSGAVLSTQTVSSFSGGVYMNYTITGNVLMTITKEAGDNAVLSGLFLDSSTPSASTSATYNGNDTTTRGTGLESTAAWATT